jgi:hypothetical protein
MPGKSPDYGNRVIKALAGAAAAYVTRKAIVFAWTKATGRQPPEAAEDPQVAIGEAVIWALVLGASVGVARVLAIRLAARQTAGEITDSDEVGG